MDSPLSLLIAFGVAGLAAQRALAALLTNPGAAIAAGVGFSILGGMLRAGASRVGGGSSSGASRGSAVFSSPGAASAYRPGLGASSAVPYQPVVALPPRPSSWSGPGAAGQITGTLRAGPRGMEAVVAYENRYRAATSTSR